MSRRIIIILQQLFTSIFDLEKNESPSLTQSSASKNLSLGGQALPVIPEVGPTPLPGQRLRARAESQDSPRKKNDEKLSLAEENMLQGRAPLGAISSSLQEPS